MPLFVETNWLPAKMLAQLETLCSADAIIDEKDQAFLRSLMEFFEFNHRLSRSQLFQIFRLVNKWWPANSGLISEESDESVTSK